MNVKTFSTTYLIIVFLLLSAFGLTACGGGVSEPPNNNPDGRSNPAQISGQVDKGPISGGTVTAYSVTSSGGKGSVLKTAVTDAKGNYSLAIDNYSGLVLFEITGGYYVDEATGNNFNLTTVL